MCASDLDHVRIVVAHRRSGPWRSPIGVRAHLYHRVVDHRERAHGGTGVGVRSDRNRWPRLRVDAHDANDEVGSSMMRFSCSPTARGGARAIERARTPGNAVTRTRSRERYAPETFGDVRASAGNLGRAVSIVDPLQLRAASDGLSSSLAAPIVVPTSRDGQRH